MSEQERLLKALCQAIGGQARAVDWGDLSPAEWEALSRAADEQGVAPLLYWTLTLDGWPVSAPTEARRRLERAYYSSTAGNILLLSELRRILAALQGAGIPVMVLKGAALAPSIYPDPALRPMGDLDLLVRRLDLEQALAALRGLGYRGLMRNYFRCHVFMQGGVSGETAVELHWSLVESPKMQMPQAAERLWSQAEILRLEGGPEGLALNPTANLLYLSAHLWKQHRRAPRLLWCYDLHLLVEGGRVDWEALLAGGRALGWQAALRGALEMAQRYFDTELPADFLQALEGEAAGEGGGESLSRGALAAETWRGLGWHDRLGMLGGLLFPSPAYVRWRYRPDPPWLWPVYYPVRWVTLLADPADG